MKTPGYSLMLEHIYQNTRYHIQEDLNLDINNDITTKFY
jgi:hypothetical protein